MTEAVRHGSFSPAGPGTPFEPAPAEDERPAADWDGDHARAPEPSDDSGSELGVDPADLADEDLIRELGSLHRTRLDTLRHGPDPALATHLRRTAELETEYLARHPGREVDQSRVTHD